MDESEVLKFEQIKIAKLSDAMRIGAKRRPQCFGSYFKEGGSCALGAAFEGIGGDAGLEIIGLHLKQRFGFNDALQDEIVWRNDNDRQSREGIADWLESQGM